MFEGFEYVSKHGILKKSDYRAYNKRKGNCQTTQRDLDKTAALRNIGYVEKDRRSNEELRQMVAR